MTEEELIERVKRAGDAMLALEEAVKLIEEIEAKLEKAVKGLKRICLQPEYRLPSPQEIARATLAEIKAK